MNFGLLGVLHSLGSRSQYDYSILSIWSFLYLLTSFNKLLCHLVDSMVLVLTHEECFPGSPFSVSLDILLCPGTMNSCNSAFHGNKLEKAIPDHWRIEYPADATACHCYCLHLAPFFISLPASILKPGLVFNSVWWEEGRKITQFF